MIEFWLGITLLTLLALAFICRPLFGSLKAVIPEAQVDRFMFKVTISYPSKEEERQIIRMNLGNEKPKVSSVINKDAIVRARSIVRKPKLLILKDPLDLENVDFDD